MKCHLLLDVLYSSPNEESFKVPRNMNTNVVYYQILYRCFQFRSKLKKKHFSSLCHWSDFAGPCAPLAKSLLKAACCRLPPPSSGKPPSFFFGHTEFEEWHPLKLL
jgi:hypothetical protein